ncbi:hypothetical protein FHX96_001023 [Clostridium tetanomorphum]|nr:hypothetical protein [Clostridium tetanomorphum]NRZ96333.1 hypothetical protein [Clostridium tetanomorphum]
MACQSTGRQRTSCLHSLRFRKSEVSRERNCETNDREDKRKI